MKSLIVGMGIGQLYKSVLTNLGHEVITVDSVKVSDFVTVADAINYHDYFDTVHICTPNYTHLPIATRVAPKSGIIFVEKPGFENATSWGTFVKSFPNTRIMMVKNNAWRENITEMSQCYVNCSEVRAHWLNNNRIPNPGSWFTTKSLSFGGVSRDLLPHLLSFVTALDSNYKNVQHMYRHSWQRWGLADLISSDYGTVDLTGKYDVDDHVELEFKIGPKRWFVKSSWKTDAESDISISFDSNKFQLGLCPEDAYQNMISDAVSNKNNDSFWLEQFEKDIWIHQNINI
jgi:hypothetical protein